MSIPVIVFIRPNGQKEEATIQRPDDIEIMAKEFINSGGRYTVEPLGGMGTSYCAEFKVDDEIQDIACEIGFDSDPPNIKHFAAFDEVVKQSIKFLKYKGMTKQWLGYEEDNANQK